MDIPKLSMALSEYKVMSSVNISLIKMAKDQMQQTGEQMADMISETGKIDIKI